MSNILSRINKNHLIPRLFSLIISCFFLAFIYNEYLVENNIVTGGISGLAILIKAATNLDTTAFINVSNVILIVLSFIILGRKKTVDQLIGTAIYLLMVNITSPITKVVDFSFDSNIIMIVFVSIIYGISSGFIYRAGYSTGGTDFLTHILADKLKKPITYWSLLIQIVIIGASAFVFDVRRVMFSVFIIYVSNKITNSVLFGVSTMRMVYVISNKNDEIEDYIMNRINTGATEIKVHGGLFEKKKQLLMCVVHNAQYTKFKNRVLEMDPNAFIVSNNCYEVNGGQKFDLLPF